MKTNKTLMATLAVGTLLAFSPMLRAADTNAPTAGTPPPAGASPKGGMRGRMMGPNIDQIAKDLNLTDDQKAKVKTVLDDQRTKFQDLMKDTSLSREDRRTKMQAIRADTNAKMKDILTSDQYAQWEKMRPGARQRRNAAPPADNKPAADNQAQQ
jgi:Spy/CpxP family protein refolding chaperone